MDRDGSAKREELHAPRDNTAHIYENERLDSDTLTLYVARISEERTWQHVLEDPIGSDYTDTWLVAGAYSRAYGRSGDAPLRREWEVNVAYNFGEQDHFELNLVPLTLRWQRFPWSETVHTTAAFGAGLSYAFGFPELENRIEGDTTQLLIFWLLELTLGPPPTDRGRCRCASITAPRDSASWCRGRRHERAGDRRPLPVLRRGPPAKVAPR